MRYPWDTPEVPAVVEPAPLPVALPIGDTLAALQRDVAYMVTHTCIVVRASRPELELIVNTRRGQIVPRGECRFTDGSKFELCDIGMPQPKAQEMTVQDLMAHLWNVARGLELELET